VAGLLLAGLMTGASVATAETTRAHEAGWREPLGRAEAALADGEARRAEQAWEEAHRAAMRPAMPPSGLVNVGRAYLRIGQAAHDRQTAVSRARQLFLRAMFRARDRRDVDGLTAASQAFASLGDCEMAERAFTVVLKIAPQHREKPPVCDRTDASRQPSASPRSDVIIEPRPQTAR